MTLKKIIADYAKPIEFLPIYWRKKSWVPDWLWRRFAEQFIEEKEDIFTADEKHESTGELMPYIFYWWGSSNPKQNEKALRRLTKREMS